MTKMTPKEDKQCVETARALLKYYFPLWASLKRTPEEDKQVLERTGALFRNCFPLCGPFENDFPIRQAVRRDGTRHRQALFSSLGPF